MAVGTLAPQRHLAVHAVERHAEADQVTDALRRLRHQDARRLLVHQPGAGLDGIAQVELRRVARPHRGGDASLRITGVALVDGAFGQDKHGAMLTRQQRCVEPRYPRAGDDVVVAQTVPPQEPPFSSPRPPEACRRFPGGRISVLLTLTLPRIAVSVNLGRSSRPFKGPPLT